MSEALRHRLEAIRPTCAHGRVVRSLLQTPRGCAGTIKDCECCANATCKPDSASRPWLCRECSGGAR